MSQFTELHVVAALLKTQNHNIKVIEIFTEQAFSFIMHKFFNQYLKIEDAKSAMKEWLLFRDQEGEFHQASEC